jgi:hypothetical protein
VASVPIPKFASLCGALALGRKSAPTSSAIAQADSQKVSKAP